MFKYKFKKKWAKIRPGLNLITTHRVPTTRKPIRAIKIYWVYDHDGYFLGGNPCPVGKEYFAQEHLKWCQEQYPKAYLEWVDGVYTYKESYVVVRLKCEQVQRDQPGIRAMWYNPNLNRAVQALAVPGEKDDVDTARRLDAEDRLILGTHDQGVIDEYRRKRDGQVPALEDRKLLEEGS